MILEGNLEEAIEKITCLMSFKWQKILVDTLETKGQFGRRNKKRSQ